jgi:glyoxylase-like metal-dependent hydrolase (beta-lactamase superfamily II)
LRAFLVGAGVAPEERAELEQMWVFSKNFYESVPVDRVLEDGARVYDYVVHHMPGHCPGQICLQAGNILLTADHVLGRITPTQSPESITPSTGLDHYLEALHKCRHIAGVDLALPGHEDPIEHLYQRIGEIEAFHRSRLEKVRAACNGDAHTVKEIALALFGERQGYDRLLALQETGAHVEYLARRGTLEIENVEVLLRERDPALRYRARPAPAVVSPVAARS